MTRSPFPVALVIAACAGCYAETQNPAPPPAQRGIASVEPQLDTHPPAGAVESDTDRAIRRDLDLAIHGDPHLKDRAIKFLVTNGEVSVTGVVKHEDERKRVNAIAMDVTGVKSVANALRIAE